MKGILDKLNIDIILAVFALIGGIGIFSLLGILIGKTISRIIALEVS